MRIADIKIRNFRKLKDISVDLHDDTTVFIGANNSGKTSAMAAMRYFLKQNRDSFNVHDFTLSNYARMREIGTKLESEAEEKPEARDLSLWKDILPSLDIWFDVGDDDIHYVSHILPTLDWTGGSLGIRLQYEPEDVAKFYSVYKEARAHAEELKAKPLASGKLCDADLFPKDMFDFLKRDLKDYFVVRFYVLDPTKKGQEQEASDAPPIEGNPLVGLIQIDEINAQRGLNDEAGNVSANEQRHLSQQLTEYYNQHLDPSKDPTEKDIEALDAIYKAQKSFTNSMSHGFEPALQELGKLGYPGFYNPNIKIEPHLKPTDGLNHSSALQYELDGCKDSFLPETYNGLGYQNLIFMAFKLIQFRDSWLKIGKQKVTQPEGTNIEYPPIHLVLVEEPEAHLHPQAQQVFIKQAYKILTNRAEVGIGKLTTQLIITTHSSHITHECDFAHLRYFKRIPPIAGEVQSSTVVNLSDMFGANKETERFVSRYIKLTHCDLFFADAVVMIEGDAERILLPHFFRRFDYLNQSYISLLSIGGSHAHRLRPFMETLEIPTLIITDLDATKEIEKDGKKKWESTWVALGASQKTNNDTLKTWFPKKENIDDLLRLSPNDKKQDAPFALRVAFQTPITVSGEEVLPYTFEDSLIFTNKAIFSGVADVKGMIKKAQSITDAQSAFEVIRSGTFKKAEFALDLLYFPNFDDIQVPDYISEGLKWLEGILQPKLAQAPLVKDKAEIKNAK